MYALWIVDEAGAARVWERGSYPTLKRLAQELPANGWAFLTILWSGVDLADHRAA